MVQRATKVQEARMLAWLRDSHWPEGVRLYGPQWLRQGLEKLCEEIAATGTQVVEVYADEELAVDSGAVLSAMRDEVERYERATGA